MSIVKRDQIIIDRKLNIAGDIIFSAAADRYCFEEIINKALQIENKMQAKCHYISFLYLKNSLTNLANLLVQGSIMRKKFNSDIDILTEAVLTGEGTESVDHRYKGNVESIYEQVQRCGQYVKNTDVTSDDFVRGLNLLLYYMNSVYDNLRIGNSRWNSSIGEYYDPDRWVFSGADGRLTNSNLALDIRFDQNYRDNEGGFPENTFYLISEVDIRKLNILFKLKSVPAPQMFTAIYNGRPIIYSSNNAFAFGQREEYEECGFPIKWIKE